MSKHERAFRDFYGYADDEEIDEDELVMFDEKSADMCRCPEDAFEDD